MEAKEKKVTNMKANFIGVKIKNTYQGMLYFLKDMYFTLKEIKYLPGHTLLSQVDKKEHQNTIG